MIPSCVHPVMEELGLIGMRIQRMPSSENEFGDPSEYSYLTVCCASCHDVSTTRAWWEEDAERARRLFRTFFSENNNVSELCTPRLLIYFDFGVICSCVRNHAKDCTTTFPESFDFGCFTNTRYLCFVG